MRDDERLHLGRQSLLGGVGIGGPGQHLRLVMIAEEQVDAAFVDHLGEAVAALGNDDAFGQRERDLAARFVRDVARRFHRATRLVGAEEIAFEVEDFGRAYEVGADCLRHQFVAGARRGVHRALPVGGHEDEAATRRMIAARGQRRRIEMYAQRLEIVAEDLAELVVGDLPDEGRCAAHRRDPRHAVGRRSARMFFRDTHAGVKSIGLGGREQLHGARGQRMLDQEFGRAGRDDVDDRIAHRNDIETRLAHVPAHFLPVPG